MGGKAGCGAPVVMERRGCRGDWRWVRWGRRRGEGRGRGRGCVVDMRDCGTGVGGVGL